MSQLNELTALKAQVDRLRDKAAQAKGALKVALAELKNDWNCDSINAAQDLLKEREIALERLRNEYRSRLQEFREKYADELSRA